jgi:predicted protein tyrosine phosphatase
MKNILILSKKMFDDLMIKHNITNENVIEKNIAFISINDTGGTNQVPYFNENSNNNVLVLYFDDIEEDIQTEKRLIKAFTIEQAKIVFNFIKNNEDKTTFIIHCSAGISRSGAVGTFINDYFRQSYFEFLEKNPHILPNGHVLRLLNKILYENL